MKSTVLPNGWRAGCLAAFGALLLWPAANAGETTKQPVLVELYTSQGCSSCPAADKILGELAKRDDVVTLSFSIDYWDYIGWRDTLATRENTLRQQAYEAVMPSRRVYTPQMIVDGVQDVVGNQRRDVLDAVQKRLNETRGKRVPVSIGQTNGSVQIKIGAGGPPAKPATVWVAHTLSSRTVNIAKGENSGRVITYHNVVRDFASAGKWSGQAITLNAPARGRTGELTDGIAVWVQVGDNGPVLGAGQARIN